MPLTRVLVVALMLCALVAGCGGGSDDPSGDRADRSSPVAPADASTTPGDDSSASPSSRAGSAAGPGRDLGDLCTSIPIAGLAAQKVDGKVVVTSLGPKDTPSRSVICNYGSPDFDRRISKQDKRALQFSVVYETYPDGSCTATLEAMKRAGNVVKGDHYELTLGAVGVCRGNSSLAIARTAVAPPDGSDVALMRRMLAVAEPRMDDLAERARIDGA